MQSANARGILLPVVAAKVQAESMDSVAEFLVLPQVENTEAFREEQPTQGCNYPAFSNPPTLTMRLYCAQYTGMISMTTRTSFNQTLISRRIRCLPR